jgi:hypothetical protein
MCLTCALVTASFLGSKEPVLPRSSLSNPASMNLSHSCLEILPLLSVSMRISFCFASSALSICLSTGFGSICPPSAAFPRIAQVAARTAMANITLLRFDIFRFFAEMESAECGCFIAFLTLAVERVRAGIPRSSGPVPSRPGFAANWLLELNPECQLSGTVARVLRRLCSVQHTECTLVADIRWWGCQVCTIQYVSKC